MRKTIYITALIALISPAIYAQAFSSGSTGADGALDLSTMNCPNNVCKIQVPDSGIFNFTTINIPAGKVLAFTPNARNTPVTLLAQSTVTIDGQISVSSSGRTPGPGGFHGGDANASGFGPGGGQFAGAVGCNHFFCSPSYPTSVYGKWVGALSLVPIIGGSGGAGDGGDVGGGGGGAIVIASSSSIKIAGGIDANSFLSSTSFCCGPAGSGGAIRIVANSVNISGTLAANGSGLGGVGVIRIEAPASSLNFTGSALPAAVLSEINPVVIQNNAPQLTIATVGGFPVASRSGSRLDSVDILLPMQLPDPISIVIQANNIPTGTQVTVQSAGSANATSTTCTLAGSLASSSATCTISNLNRSAVTYLLAVATFTPPIAALRVNPTGRIHVAKVRIETTPGAKPKLVFLRRDGTEIDQAKLPRKFLEQFGL